jgi:hypothetical protein
MHGYRVLGVPYSHSPSGSTAFGYCPKGDTSTRQRANNAERGRVREWRSCGWPLARLRVDSPTASARARDANRREVRAYVALGPTLGPRPETWPSARVARGMAHKSAVGANQLLDLPPTESRRERSLLQDAPARVRGHSAPHALKERN